MYWFQIELIYWRLQSMGTLRVRHDWATSLSLFPFMHWIRKQAQFLIQGQVTFIPKPLWRNPVCMQDLRLTPASENQNSPVNQIPMWSFMLCYAKSLQSCPTLCDPIDGSHQAPPSLGFSRQERWSGLPFPSPMHESEKWKRSHLVVSNS